MKIVCISDTHCQLHKLEVPEGDVLIHAGDLTYKGEFSETVKELTKLSNLKSYFNYIVLVEGNHDWLGALNPTLMNELCKERDIILLRDSAALIDGQLFYGSPWQPEFCGWAFNLPRGQQLKDKWALIPDETNVLITHGPPKGILDLVPRPRGFRAGCEDLTNRVKELKDLKLHCFGHLHDNHGFEVIGDTTYVNASSCTEEYRPINNPIMVEI